MSQEDMSIEERKAYDCTVYSARVVLDNTTPPNWRLGYTVDMAEMTGQTILVTKSECLASGWIYQQLGGHRWYWLEAWLTDIKLVSGEEVVDSE